MQVVGQASGMSRLFWEQADIRGCGWTGWWWTQSMTNHSLLFPPENREYLRKQQENQTSGGRSGTRRCKYLQLINALPPKMPTFLLLPGTGVLSRGSGNPIRPNCENASNIGSDANLLMFGSCCANHPGLKQVELSAAVHLPFDELELSDLALGLSIRPWGIDGGANSGFVFADTAGKRGHEAS